MSPLPRQDVIRHELVQRIVEAYDRGGPITDGKMLQVKMLEVKAPEAKK